eukprot:6194035-Pleurochrysis_carterae.AAC.2
MKPTKQAVMIVHGRSLVPHTKVAGAQHPGGEILSLDPRPRSTSMLARTIIGIGRELEPLSPSLRGAVEPARYQY